MSVERQVMDDEPLMIAWKTHQKTEEFANSKKWAAQPEHLQGSLWALFAAGFNASQQPELSEDEAVEAAYREGFMEAADRHGNTPDVAKRLCDELWPQSAAYRATITRRGV